MALVQGANGAHLVHVRAHGLDGFVMLQIFFHIVKSLNGEDTELQRCHGQERWNHRVAES